MALLDEDEKARKTIASHTASCMVIDMGEYNFAEFSNTEADADATGKAVLRGFHVIQILPMDLACRAFVFPDVDDFQVRDPPDQAANYAEFAPRLCVCNGEARRHKGLTLARFDSSFRQIM